MPAGLLHAQGNSGGSFKFLAFNATNQVWNGAAYEDWDDLNVTTYSINANQLGTSGLFVGVAPALSVWGIMASAPLSVPLVSSAPITPLFFGSDGRVLLSADTQTNVTIPTIGTVTGSINGNVSGKVLGSGASNIVGVGVETGGIVFGTAQAGSSTTITLAAGASAVNDYFTGQVINITSGTGAGQSRTVTLYVGSTKIATVDAAWKTNPDNTSKYNFPGLNTNVTTTIRNVTVTNRNVTVTEN